MKGMKTLTIKVDDATHAYLKQAAADDRRSMHAYLQTIIARDQQQHEQASA